MTTTTTRRIPTQTRATWARRNCEGGWERTADCNCCYEGAAVAAAAATVGAGAMGRAMRCAAAAGASPSPSLHQRTPLRRVRAPDKAMRDSIPFCRCRRNGVRCTSGVQTTATSALRFLKLRNKIQRATDETERSGASENCYAWHHKASAGHNKTRESLGADDRHSHGRRPLRADLLRPLSHRMACIPSVQSAGWLDAHPNRLVCHPSGVIQ